jgi:hypothetical protein
MKEGRTIVFVDQSGFYLLPAVVRTYTLLSGRRRPSSAKSSRAIISRR